MMYGEELHSAHSGILAATAMTAIELEAATGAKLTLPCPLPGMVLYWGYQPTVTFDYDTLVTEGKLTLYRYTKVIQTAVLGNAGGTGYAVGDLLSITQAGASGGIVRVTGVTAGVVTTVEVVNPGINYRAEANLVTAKLNGAGDDAFTCTISDKKAIDTMVLRDGAVLGKQYMRRVPNALGDDISPTPAPPASFKAGEQLVIEVTTQANGGTEVGDYQTILIVQHRGENFAAQPLWVEEDAE